MWTRETEAQPPPHRVYRVYDPATQRQFDATPCYGMHDPWWVPRNGFTLEESEPMRMSGTYWTHLPAPP